MTYSPMFRRAKRKCTCCQKWHDAYLLKGQNPPYLCMPCFKYTSRLHEAHAEQLRQVCENIHNEYRAMVLDPDYITVTLAHYKEMLCQSTKMTGA